MSDPNYGDMFFHAKELDRLRKEQEDVITEINKLHKKLKTTPWIVEKHGDTSLYRLKSLYTHAKELAESEVSVSNMFLSQLDAVLSTGPSRQQPRTRDSKDNQQIKKQKPASDISRDSPPLRNQLETYANLKGQHVAARVTKKNAEKDEYIVVKVIHFDRESREFDVIDEEPGEDEEGGKQRKFKLTMTNIIPFPKRSDPSSAQEFPPGKAVLAVYPGTTALYKAVVISSRKYRTKLKKKTDELTYKLEFDDDESDDGTMPQRTVPFYNIVALPGGHRQ